MKQLFEQSTQFQHWRFSSERLMEIRDKNAQMALERVRALLSEEETISKDSSEDSPSKTATGVDALQKADSEKQRNEAIATGISAVDQLTLCRFYESKIQDYCKYFKFPFRVQATAIVYFKRFYLSRSILDWNPKEIMVTCIFLATKTENHYISVEKFASKLPKVESSWIIEQEFVVMDALRFNLMIHHPYLALHGLFLDMQDLIENHDILFDIYEKSIQLCHESYLSDVCLIYQPSQIALAIFTRAAKSLGLDLIEKYIHVRFRDHEKLADLLSILEEIGSVLEGSSKPDKNVVAEIDRRLFFLRNPLSDPNINLFQKMRRKEEKDEQNII